MSIQDRIKSVQDEKTALLTSMEELAEKDTLDQGEQDKFDDIKSQIKSLNISLSNLEETEQLMATEKAQPLDIPQDHSPAKVTPEIEQDKTLFFARQVHALYVNNGNKYAAADYAKHTLGDELLSKTLKMPEDVIQRAAVITGESGVAGFMAELVQVNQANQAFIEMLRPMSVLARFPGRNMTFDGAGSIKIPRQSLGSTGGWVAEGDAIKVDRLTLDSIELTPKKNANIMAISKELAARSTPSALALVRDDLLSGIGTAIDTKFVSNDSAVAGTSPAGLLTYAGTPVAAVDGSLNEILVALKTAIAQMLEVNMPMASPVWILNPVTLNGLKFITDGLGMPYFKDEINSGTLAGYPYLTSTTTSVDNVILSDASQIITALELAPSIEVSMDATLMMDDDPASPITGGAATSMFQTDSIAVKATTRGDWGARYAECVQLITGTTAWG